MIVSIGANNWKTIPILQYDSEYSRTLISNYSIAAICKTRNERGLFLIDSAKISIIKPEYSNIYKPEMIWNIALPFCNDLKITQKNPMQMLFNTCAYCYG